ncbi:MAG: nucleotidyl transferase AbiEii/AbiGii toxin family protein, partial [Candidatus Omnitrophota bacterium]|nr:nucleotidyl transferase AbiEii/AbiGii toxin family protein [Candidatus Omnitrophota bacterium]
MNRMLYDLSGKIEPSIISALLEIKKITDGLKIDFFVIGATARDIIMQHFPIINSPRMTKDIDIAVCVTNWEEYEALTDTLLATGKFLKGDQKQRYIFGGTVIDIIPFGDISGRDNTIKWPPDYGTIMCTVGFMDVYNNSITFRLSSEPVLDIKLATIPGLAIMKLLAWNDDPTRQKDAEDLLFFMLNYQYAGIEDRLYENEISLLLEEEFENERAGIRLLGRDMARISSSDTAKALMD